MVILQRVENHKKELPKYDNMVDNLFGAIPFYIGIKVFNKIAIKHKWKKF